ncbi:MAG: ATP-dependent DNA helicase RecG [Candidatus Eisenbacteria bacterium]
MSPSPASIDPESPVHFLPGIGPARSEDLATRGIATVGDLLRLFPREYILPGERRKVAEVSEGETAVLDVRLESIRLLRRGWRRSVVDARVADETGSARCLWFHAAYLAKSLKPGARLLLKGSLGGKPPAFLHPRFEVVRDGEESEFERIVSRYPSIPRLPPRTLRRAIRYALERLPAGEDPLPEDLRAKHGLPEWTESLRSVHRPEGPEEAARARRRFVFEELYRLQSAFAAATRSRAEARAPHAHPEPGRFYEPFLKGLPFRLTGDQERSLREIRADLESGRPMERLLVGDVGSGKTVVAAAAMAWAAGHGGQAALLAPTEVLARQHHRVLEAAFGPLGASPALLTGDLPAAEARRVRERIASGEELLVVGTHALLQETTRFHDLALAVVDEQHRFGVRQRGILPGKGDKAHFLLLSATPIPRSLALTLYGDLDLSVIKTLPPGRKPVETKRVADKGAKEAYERLRERVDAGEQGFVLFPLVEEDEAEDAPEGPKAAVQAADKLARGFFRGRSVGLLHGRLPAPERIETIDRLRRGEIDVLVATTVVEVGVDLPRATVMIIENADRFGLSQLHQIRGRVGRSDLPSWCYLVTRGPFTPQAEERLAVLESERDGFRIAEEDLRLRGTGDLLGERQHGPLGLGAADLIRDADLLEIARAEAFARGPSEGPLPRPPRAG